MSQPAFDSLLSDTREKIGEAVSVLQAGSLTPGEFGHRMADLLEEAHTQAVVLGRHAAGDTAPPEADDSTFALQVVDSESEYLAGFVRDLESGRYDQSEAALSLRAASYAGRLVGTANEAWALAGEPEEVYHWRLGPETAHCPDCPAFAAGGPYTQETLPAYPGDNTSACLFSCRCWLETESGQRGFSHPEV